MDYVYIHRCIIGMFRACEELPARDRWLVFTKEGVNLQDFNPGKSPNFSVWRVPKSVFTVGLTGEGWERLKKVILYYINLNCKTERPIFTAPDKWTSQIGFAEPHQTRANNEM